jgi:hypothetical protein
LPRTVVVVLDQRTVAEGVRDALLGAGFSGSAITIQSLDRAAAASHPVTTAPPTGHAETTIEHFFRSMFGFAEDVGRYTTAANSGKAVLILRVDDAPAAERARAVIERAAPGEAVRIHAD